MWQVAHEVSRIVSEGLIGRKWNKWQVDSEHTQNNGSATLWHIPWPSVCSEDAIWRSSTVTSCFGQSNVFAHQIQKLAQIKKHTFLLISSECFFCRQIYCSHYFAHMQSYCSRNYSAWSFYIPSFKPAQCRNVALGSILRVSSCIYSYIHLSHYKYVHLNTYFFCCQWH